VKKRVAVVFGGPSREHGVSFFSARCLLENMPPDKYEPVPLFVGKDGLWHGPDASAEEMRAQMARPSRDLLLDGVVPGETTAPAEELAASFFETFRAARPDVVFPIVHGTYGEDGTLQGLLECLGIPYVGFGVAASAVAMDKIFMKAVFAAAGLPQTRYHAVEGKELRSYGRRHLLMERLEMMPLPLFVKPACAGSSVGVSKVREHGELEGALKEALDIDVRALVEEGVDAREIECSVLEGIDGGPTEASMPGEIVPSREFYDYEDKYIAEGSYSVIPADIPEDVREEVRGLAIAAFDVLGGSGFARVDFFLERGGGRVLLNELNSLPGFTPISMFPKMWEASGLSLPALLDRLVKSAFARPMRGR